MRSRVLAGSVSLALILTWSAVATEEGQPAGPEDPRRLGIVEQTGRRLLQVDVTVRGPADAVDTLTPEDFIVEVDGREIEGFLLDRVCSEEPAVSIDAAPGSIATGDGAAPVPGPAGASYLFYFDQHHLTMVGRERSLDLSAELIRDLIQPPHRAMIVSSGQEVRTFAELTSDQPVLLDALERLRQDKKQWDPYPSQEDRRVEEIFAALGLGLDAGRGVGGFYESQALAAQSAESRAEARRAVGRASPQRGFGGGASSAAADARAQRDSALASRADAKKKGVQHAKQIARSYQNEERWHTEKALARFTMVLGRLAGVDPPKAVIYFADRMRSNAGDHFMGIFGKPDEREFNEPTFQVLPGAGSAGFDQLIDTASAHGVRLYTVQAEGLVTGISASPLSGKTINVVSSDPRSTSRRFDDAKNSLAGLAAETGGESFLNGVGPARIAKRIRQDLACVYLISLDPAGLPEDRRLPLRIWVDRPKVKVQARARVLVPSQATRLTTRLAAAFTTRGGGSADAGMGALVIPTGYREGKFTALVQVVVPGAEIGAADWDLGASVLSNGSVRQEASTNVQVSAPGVPVVFENEMEFSPGPWELIAVAHDRARDEIVTTRVEGDWPDPEEQAVTIGPIALVQPAQGVFVRDERHKAQGALGRRDEDWVRPDRPAALLAMVCRKKSDRRPIEVERTLEGETLVEFPALHIGDEEDRCVLLSDLIPPDTMTEGEFNYAVRVIEEGSEIASRARPFTAVQPEPQQPAAPTP